MFKHILLPTDGSELSARAVKQTIKLAKALKAHITAIQGIAAPGVRYGRGLPLGPVHKTVYNLPYCDGAHSNESKRLTTAQWQTHLALS